MMSSLLVYGFITYRKRTVGDPLCRFARWFMHAYIQSVSRIIEVYQGLQTLEVAIMRVRLYETEIRPLVYVATGWDLNFAVELGREYRPARVWVLPGTYAWTRFLTERHCETNVSEEGADS